MKKTGSTGNLLNNFNYEKIPSLRPITSTNRNISKKSSIKFSSNNNNFNSFDNDPSKQFSTIKNKKYDYSLINKTSKELYDELMILKRKVNFLNAEISLEKSSRLKKDEQLNSKTKEIESYLSDIQMSKDLNPINIDKLKETNTINQLKKEFYVTKNTLSDLKNKTNMLKSKIKKAKPNIIRQSNIILEKRLKSLLQEYYVLQNKNSCILEEIEQVKPLSKIFAENHEKIEYLKNRIDVQEKNISELNDSINGINSKQYINEVLLDRQKVQNINLNKKNLHLEKEIEHKKQISKMKLNYKKRIKILTLKKDELEGIFKSNEREISDIKQNIKHIEKMKQIDPLKLDAFDYSKIKKIEKNPDEMCNSKILLLQSLIEESMNKKKKYREIIDSYIERFQNLGYDYSELDKMLEQNEEKNNNDHNNDNNINKENNNNENKIDENEENKDKDKTIDNNDNKNEEEKNNVENNENNNENNNNISFNNIDKNNNEDNNINNNKKKDDINENNDKNDNKENINDNNNIVINNENNNKDNISDNINNNDINLNNNEDNNKNNNEENKNKKIDEIEKKDKENMIDNNNNINNNLIENQIDKPKISERDTILNKEDDKKSNKSKEEEQKNNNEEVPKNSKEEEKEENNSENDVNNNGIISDEKELIPIENKESQNQNNNNIEIEPLSKQKSENILSNEEFSELTYILIKNFECKKINEEMARQKIIMASTKDEIEKIRFIEQMSFNIMKAVHCENKDSLEKVKSWITTLLQMCGNDQKKVTDNFLSLFTNINIYNSEQELIYSKKIKKSFLEKKDIIYKKLEPFRNKYVSFYFLKQLIEEQNIDLKDEYAQYLFYELKKFDDPNSSLYDLKVQNLFNILENNENDSKMDTESDIEITNEQYVNIITNFGMKLIKYLDTNKTDLRTVLGDLVQNLSNGETQDGEKIEVVLIEPFINKMREIGITLSSEIEIYCLFSRYKLSDDYEIISVNLLEKELENFRQTNIGNYSNNNDINSINGINNINNLNGVGTGIVNAEGNNLKVMEKVQEENEDNISNSENK